MGQDDDWDPTAATEQASAPTNVKLNGTTLAWDNNDYALLWAVCKNGKVVDFTIKPTYLVDDASATWSVRAANEMGGLSEATAAGSLSTGIQNIAAATDAAVIKTAIYAADGTQLSNLQKGINIIVKTLADGSKKTSKVIVECNIPILFQKGAEYCTFFVPSTPETAKTGTEKTDHRNVKNRVFTQKSVNVYVIFYPQYTYILIFFIYFCNKKTTT